MSKSYNYIYDQLVESSDDVSGIISYSVYKRQKIKFIQDFKDKNGKEPDDADLKSFFELSTSPQQLQFYKSEAIVLTENFLTEILAADLKEREKFFSDKVHNELKNIKPNHLVDILKGAAGSLLFVILTGALYMAVWSLSVSPKMIVEKIFNVEIVSLNEK